MFLRKKVSRERENVETVEENCFNVVYVTVPTETVGKEIGEKLVNDRLAACVNIVPGLQSIFQWEERVAVDKELLLVIKSRKELFQLLQWTVKDLHPYDTPEIVSLPLQDISEEYRNWLELSLLTNVHG